MRKCIALLVALSSGISVSALLLCACARRDAGARRSDGGGGTNAASTSPSDGALANGVGADGAADGGLDSGESSEGSAPVARAITYKNVLLCGDSQVGYGHGLTRALKAKFLDAGASQYYWDAFTSASVQGYDEADRLPKLIARRKPDVVFITIGSNNVQNPHPEGLAGNVRSLARKAKAGDPNRDCFILGPPLPIKGVKKDTGIIRVLAENSAPCKFFDTSELVLPRQADKIHPDDVGGEIWANALWHFMQTGEQLDSGAW